MIEKRNTKILAFVGLAGAGKSSAVDYLTEKKYPKVYFGGIIYKAMNEAGIEITWDSQKQFREEIREREGKDFVAKRVMQETKDLIEAGQHRIVLDGLYTWSEYKLLRHEFHGQMTIIAIVTPKAERKHRLASRSERPMNSNEVDERDWAEIENLEKGGPIAIADHYIINSGPIDRLHYDIDELLRELDF